MCDATIKLEYEWMVVKCKLWAQQCSIYLLNLLLVVIHSRKNKMEKVDGFAVILIELSSARW